MSYHVFLVTKFCNKAQLLGCKKVAYWHVRSACLYRHCGSKLTWKMAPPQQVPNVPVTSPIICQHSRRAGVPPVDNSRTRRSLFSDPDYHWSTDVRSKKLVPEYLAHVEAGIKAAAKDLKFCLKPVDLAWLHDHQGRFQ